jgi:hypothetical protein
MSNGVRESSTPFSSRITTAQLPGFLGGLGRPALG